MMERTKRERIGAAAAAAVLGLSLGATQLQAQTQPQPQAGDPRVIGNLSLVTPAKVQQAVALIKQGRSYDLTMTLEPGAPAFPPRYFNMSLIYNNVYNSLGSNQFTWSDELITGYLGTFTQVDCFGHPGVGEEFYGGRKWRDIATPYGLKELGCETLHPTMTRGVVLDIAALKGVPMLAAGTEVTAADLQGAIRRQNIQAIQPGDVVLIHTGWMSMYGTDPQAWVAGEPGIGRDAAEWLARQRPLAVGADTWGVDVWPNQGQEAFAGHQILAVQNGVLLLENVVTRELIQDRVNEFAFQFSFLPVKGSGQTWGTFTAYR